MAKYVYFVVDFAYNLQAPIPLKIFELGDAFISGYVPQIIGHQKHTLFQTFMNDLKTYYPEALLVKVFGGGLSFVDLTALETSWISYDNTEMFDVRANHYAVSF